MNPVAEEDDERLRMGIDPNGRAGETGVAE
jgi:hypothetical protein